MTPNSSAPQNSIFSRPAILAGLLIFCLVSSTAFARQFETPASLIKTIATFKTSGDQDLQARGLALETLIAKLQDLKSPSLSESLFQSDLDSSTLKTLSAHSKGVLSVDDLEGSLHLEGGYSLGLSAREGIYEMISERYAMNPWTVAYPEFKIDWRKVPNHTDVFLKKVFATGQPVVFLVPDLTISYQGHSVTVDEFKWFLKDPTRMKNTYFVFGAYRMITPELLALREAASISSDMFRALFLRAIGAKTTNYDYELE